ncbi:unnamed protein product [Orchesella dallaii]|uniref:peptidylprolyl isomerase n=1 Tax=Orchesella dallaii TaxID=48710 RepID=A0ABP1PSH6_9HEXA
MNSEDKYSDADVDKVLEAGEPSEFDLQATEALENNLDFRRMLETGEVHDFQMDVPELVETAGYKEGQLEAPLLSDEKTLQETKVMHYDKNFDEVVDTILGDFSELELLMACVNDGDDRLKKMILKSGTGPTVAINQVVRVHYILSAEFVDDLIESTYKKRRPARFRLGAGEVLTILDVGTQTMRVGEISKFLATSELGYGKQGVPLENNGCIPPDSRILVQVELLDAQVHSNIDFVNGLSDAERQEVGFEKLLKLTETMKAEGNEIFKAEIYDKAFIKYKLAFGLLKDMTPMTSEENEKFLSLKVVLLNNLSMTCFKLGEFKAGFKYGKAAADLKVVKNLKAKANYWCAKCLFEMGKYEEGLGYVKTAKDLHPVNDVNELYDKYLIKIRESEAQEKETCLRMMNAVTISETKVQNPAEK